MKKFVLALLTVSAFAAPALAANKFPFVNAHYIDENTSWSEIAKTAGYVIESPVHYTINGALVDGMQTCQSNGDLYTWMTTPIFQPGSEGAKIGNHWTLVQVPTNTQAAICTFPIGNQGPCETKVVPVSQTLVTQFQVPVLAIENSAEAGSIVNYWGVAFTKTFVVPACN